MTVLPFLIPYNVFEASSRFFLRSSYREAREWWHTKGHSWFKFQKTITKQVPVSNCVVSWSYYIITYNQFRSPSPASPRHLAFMGSPGRQHNEQFGRLIWFKVLLMHCADRCSYQGDDNALLIEDNKHFSPLGGDESKCLVKHESFNTKLTRGGFYLTMLWNGHQYIKTYPKASLRSCPFIKSQYAECSGRATGCKPSTKVRLVRLSVYIFLCFFSAIFSLCFSSSVKLSKAIWCFRCSPRDAKKHLRLLVRSSFGVWSGQYTANG